MNEEPAKSPMSMGSLSSPSPSPPPQTLKPPSKAQLDDGSELSELTEDEREAEDDDGEQKQSKVRRSSRRDGKKQRGGIVPAGMWTWVKPKPKQKTPSDDEEEEEEEDVEAEPPVKPKAKAKVQREEEPEEEEDGSEYTGRRTAAPSALPKASPAPAWARPTRPAPRENGRRDPAKSTFEPESSVEEDQEEIADELPVTAQLDPEVDVTAPPLETVVPIAAAAAASSIMAGSAVIEPPSPSPSSDSARSPSPSRPTSPQSLPVLAKSTQNVAAPAPTPLRIDVPEREGSVDETEADNDMEIESELQPAHRAEALDVLASLELKFALLRERVYVEKLEELAWEEQLVCEGTHPELLHLQAELSKRKDTRLDLAARKRTYEVATANKRRRSDENATWSWWNVARDELQTDLISETNRKRRRLERERRALERPQPDRRIPNPPREVLPPPTLRQIIKSAPFSKNRRPAPNTMVYPELSSLSPKDIAEDLNFLHQHRRPLYDPHRMGTMNLALGGGIPLHNPDFDPYAGEGRIVPNHALNRPPPFQYIPGPAGYPAAPPQPLDHEMTGVPSGSGSRAPPHQYFGAAPMNPGPSHPRRSRSPDGKYHAAPWPDSAASKKVITEWAMDEDIPDRRSRAYDELRDGEEDERSHGANQAPSLPHRHTAPPHHVHAAPGHHHHVVHNHAGPRAVHHHHVVVHNHAPRSVPRAGSASLPSNGVPGPPLSPILPMAREFDMGRPRSGPPNHPTTEVLNLSAAYRPPSRDYQIVTREGHDRPMATPFVMAPTHTIPPVGSTLTNGHGAPPSHAPPPPTQGNARVASPAPPPSPRRRQASPFPAAMFAAPPPQPPPATRSPLPPASSPMMSSSGSKPTILIPLKRELSPDVAARSALSADALTRSGRTPTPTAESVMVRIHSPPERDGAPKIMGALRSPSPMRKWTPEPLASSLPQLSGETRRSPVPSMPAASMNVAQLVNGP